MSTITSLLVRDRSTDESWSGRVNGAAALLVINFNTACKTMRCIESILSGSEIPGRILILDNGSDAPDAAHLHAMLADLPAIGAELQLIRADKNLGFAGGCNLLIDQAMKLPDCLHILLLNSDAVAMPAWTAAMLNCAAQTPANIGMVGARMHKLSNPEDVDTLGIALYRSLMPADRHTVDDTLVGPTGGCCLLKRSMLEELHQISGYYFDERFFCYCEDTDLVLRAVLLGYETAYLNEVLALHEGQGSSGGNVSAFITYHGLRNSIWMHAKLLPVSLFLRLGPLLVLAHCLSIGRHGLYGRFGLLWRTYRDGLRRLPEFLRERKRYRSADRYEVEGLRARITPRFYRARYMAHVLRIEQHRRELMRR
ncbi:glycosyltransferase family 2 protein [Diaphorobacter sp. HDW4A]|uniref:glycosyltransferase n=1 Tax=Diaphorobacter sp. HDW4A TaxID=2714924 RepID=UPI0014079D49|nr:glycosyltransferase family 2 protein [Diaphorobacter sp. HDW4A]QIL78547.1 glycosyltransferase family 2 protein [Diaphorobacter sp. HDW4A]